MLGNASLHLPSLTDHSAAHPDRIFVGIHAQNEAGDLEPERDPIGGLKYTGLTCPSHPVCSRSLPMLL
jgi:hypothetical protein